MRTWRVIEGHLERTRLTVSTTICIAVAAVLFSAGVIIGFLAGAAVGAWAW
jgi:hypothetical protein